MKNGDVISRTFPIVWIYAAIVSAVVWFIWKDTTWIYSFIFGTASSLMAMSMHYRRLTQIAKTNPQDLKRASMMIYIIKYIFFGSILYLATQKESFEIIPVFIGLLSFKITLFFNVLITKNVGDGNE